MACGVGSIFALILSIILFRDFHTHVNPHKVFIYHTVIIEPIVLKTILPITYLAMRKDVSKFMCKEILSLKIFENVTIPNWNNISLFKHRSCIPITEIELKQINTGKNQDVNTDGHPIPGDGRERKDTRRPNKSTKRGTTGRGDKN